MNYRIYVDSTTGYYNLGTYSTEETIYCLDWLIKEEQTQEKVLVIECNKEDRIEFPVFLYMGNQEEYLEFKKYLKDTNQTRVTKTYKKL